MAARSQKFDLNGLTAELDGFWVYDFECLRSTACIADGLIDLTEAATAELAYQSVFFPAA